MSAHWHIGMEVERIDDTPGPYNFATYPVAGVVYTIREIYTAPDGMVILLLKEIVNNPMQTTAGFREPGFNAQRFRPVQKRKTDISIFTAMLTDTKVPA